MRFIKKLMVPMLAVFTLVLLIACNNENDDNSNDDNGTPSENIPDKNGDSENDDENDPEDVDNEPEEDPEEPEEDPLTSHLEEAIFDANSLEVLVNRIYSLEEDDVPEDLVTVEVPTVLEDPEIRQLREEASQSLSEMFASAEADEVTLYARSGYRSYQTQVHLFNNYAEAHGEEEASKFSARPGHSEHQTGLAMDVTSESVSYQLTEDFGETTEGIWVRENAHHFGFIIRYPEGSEEITGYIYEPWHLRYLGQELATEIYESGLTYEEFLIERGIEIEISQS